jgi:hypothetical protein
MERSMKLAVIFEQSCRPLEVFLTHEKETWSLPYTETARREAGETLARKGYRFESAIYRGSLVVENWLLIEAGDGFERIPR